MWGGFYFEFSKGFAEAISAYLFRAFLILVLAVFVVAITIFVVRRMKNKKAEKLNIEKNLHLVDEYFKNISDRILQAEEKLPYLKLTDNYKEVEERFNNVTLNFSYLRDYYQGIKSSYTDSEFETFMNIYSILKSDLEFIEKVLRESEEILKKEIEKKERIDRVLESVKNKKELKDRIKKVYENVYSDAVLEEKLEGIKRLDEKIEYYKSLDSKKEEYIANLINIVNKEFEEKYPLILSKDAFEAEALKREYDELLARLKIANGADRIVLIEDFLENLSKKFAALYTAKDDRSAVDDILETFSALKSKYDSIGMRFYRIDLKIGEIEELIQRKEKKEVIEKELEILKMLITNFEKDVYECKRMYDSLANFVQNIAKSSHFASEFVVLNSYMDELGRLLYECEFEKFKKLYLEAEQKAKSIVFKKFPWRKGDFLTGSFKDFFDNLFNLLGK
ncbi:hypothetical protein [Caldicellulosiruptor morganii]|uniref:Septation ring formation regulator EzrA n=1 Tax=Caldicellulosiruptor morganii TaxID=1387555 RepID=A0ABY7BPV1_9FIRM|nr:hypothetical protein [Caldicellulosiruptor morganii]WAM33932.1 hypothetical protein OTK00_000073 [Caldicellulosiruptor morganii]